MHCSWKNIITNNNLEGVQGIAPLLFSFDRVYLALVNSLRTYK